MQQRFETFTVLIAKISRSIRRIKAEEMSEFHLKGPHVSCLYYLTQLGPLTAGQLCDRCEEDKAAVSRSLEYLEQNGYVTRPDKRYRSPLTLTEKGQETGRAIAGKIDRLAEAASEGISIPPQIDTAARYTPQVKRPPTGAANRYRPRSRNTRQKPSAPVKDVTSCVIISQFLPSARRRS